MNAMTRRAALLATASVATCADPVLAVSETPSMVQLLFAEWEAAQDIACRQPTNEAMDMWTGRAVEIERSMVGVPVTSARDLAMKIIASTCYNDFGVEDPLFAEIMEVAGVSERPDYSDDDPPAPPPPKPEPVKALPTMQSLTTAIVASEVGLWFALTSENYDEAKARRGIAEAEAELATYVPADESEVAMAARFTEFRRERALAALAATEGETDVTRLFAEWRELLVQSELAGGTDEEVDARLAVIGALEIKLLETPSQSATDFAMKVCVQYGHTPLDDNAGLRIDDERLLIAEARAFANNPLYPRCDNVAFAR